MSFSTSILNPVNFSDGGIQTHINNFPTTQNVQIQNFPSGQTTMANSLPVVIASNQSTVNASVQASGVYSHALNQDGSGNIGVNIENGTSTVLTVNFPTNSSGTACYTC